MESLLQQTTLGKYRLIASLARGGMARVYLALMAGPADFHKLLVLKVLREGLLAGSDDGVNMFLNEARLAARLVHPNLIHTYEVGEVEGRYYLAMEYVEGQTYRALIFRASPDGLPLAEHLRILSEVARGLHHLHEQTDFDGRPLGAVHRDVSPQNILISYDGQVKVLDFGIAKTADAAHWTRINAIKGKIDYIAPEQLRGDEVDRRTDVFALGVLLYEALSGRRFAGGSGLSEVTKAHARLSAGEPRLAGIAPHQPAALIAIAERALAMDPAERFPDARSFGEAIDAYVAQTGLAASAPTLAAEMSAHFAADRQKLRLLVEQQVENARQDRFVDLGASGTGELPHVEHRDPSSSTFPYPVNRLPRLSLSSFPPPPVVREPPPERLRAPPWSIVILSMALAATIAWRTAPQATPFVAHTATAAAAPEPVTSPLDAPPASPLSVEPASARLAEPASALSAEPTKNAAGSIAAAPALAPLPEPSATTATALATAAPEHPATVASIHQRTPREVTIRADLTVTPAHASVRLDGVALTHPFTGELKRDDRLHELEASAPGYQTVRQLVGFDRDRQIVLRLARAHEEPRRPRRKNSKVSADEERLPSAPVPTDPAQAADEAADDDAKEVPTADDVRDVEPGADLSALRSRLRSAVDSTDPYAEDP